MNTQQFSTILTDVIVERDTTRRRSLGDDLTRTAGTSLDRGMELEVLAARKD